MILKLLMRTTSMRDWKYTLPGTVGLEMYVFLTALRLSASLVKESWSQDVLTHKENLLSKQQIPSI